MSDIGSNPPLRYEVLGDDTRFLFETFPCRIATELHPDVTRLAAQAAVADAQARGGYIRG